MLKNKQFLTANTPTNQVRIFYQSILQPPIAHVGRFESVYFAKCQSRPKASPYWLVQPTLPNLIE